MAKQQSDCSGNQPDIVPREEFTAVVSNLYLKLDHLETKRNADAMGIKLQLQQISTTMELTPIPMQPCQFFLKHTEEHTKIKTLWTRAMIGVLATWIAGLGIFIAGIVWAIAEMNHTGNH